MGSNLEVRVHPALSDRGNKKERFGKSVGDRLYNNGRRNMFNMGEATWKLLNLLGVTTAIFAFIANLNNIIAWLLGAIAIVLGVIKCFHSYENLRIKKLDRKQRERDFKVNRTIEEEEEDEIENYKPKK